MFDDPHADTRYNAAIALAQHGNAAAIPTLAEMLDPGRRCRASARSRATPAQFYKRSLIVTNALEAVEELHEQEPAADFTPVIEVLEEIIATEPADLEKARFHPTIVPRAKETLKKLANRQEARLARMNSKPGTRSAVVDTSIGRLPQFCIDYAG